MRKFASNDMTQDPASRKTESTKKKKKTLKNRPKVLVRRHQVLARHVFCFVGETPDVKVQFDRAIFAILRAGAILTRNEIASKKKKAIRGGRCLIVVADERLLWYT